MNSAVVVPIRNEYNVPSFIVRYAFPFDDLVGRYQDTEKNVEIRGKQMDKAKLDLFWKQIYRNCQDFRVLQKSSRLPLITFYVGVSFFFLGVLLLILGVVPIWGQKEMSLAMIIISGIIIVLSALTHILTKVFLGMYYRRSLYPKYEQVIVNAVREHLKDYMGLGMSWKSGTDGFRCIEFSYIPDDQADNGSAANYTKVDTVMYSETTEIFKKDRDVSPDISGLFKPGGGEQVELIKGPPKNLRKNQMKVGIAPDGESSVTVAGSSKLQDLASSKIALFDLGANSTMHLVRDSNNFDHPSNEYELPAKRRNILDTSIPDVGTNTNRRIDEEDPKDGNSIDFGSKAV